MSISIKEISTELNQLAENLAPQYISQRPMKKIGQELRFGNKGSVRVFISGPKIGQWTDYSEDLSGDMLELIRISFGINMGQAVSIAKEILGITKDQTYTAPVINKEDEEKRKKERQERIEQEAQKRQRRALRIWNESQSIFPIPYLKNRKIECDKNPFIRIQHIDEYQKRWLNLSTPVEGPIEGIVFAATDENNEIKAIQRVLTQNGYKLKVDTAKLTYGTLNNTLVKFDDACESMAIGEGPETSLSWRMTTKQATWCALGLSNLINAKFPEIVKSVTILGDIEISGAGLIGAIKAYNNIDTQDCAAEIAFPKDPMELISCDFNDILQNEGPDALPVLSKHYKTKNRFRNKEHLIIAKDSREIWKTWLEEGGSIHLITKDKKDHTLAQWINIKKTPEIKTITIIGERHEIGDLSPFNDLEIFWREPQSNPQKTWNAKKLPLNILNDDPTKPVIIGSPLSDPTWFQGPYCQWSSSMDIKSVDWSIIEKRHVILALPVTETGIKVSALIAAKVEECGGYIWMARLPPKRIPNGIAPFETKGFDIQKARMMNWDPTNLRKRIVSDAIRVIWPNTPHKQT